MVLERFCLSIYCNIIKQKYFNLLYPEKLDKKAKYIYSKAKKLPQTE